MGRPVVRHPLTFFRIIPTMQSFWHKLQEPIFALAPMEGVTDTVFRQIVAECGRPDVFFTEFTNVEGLFSKGGEHVVQRFRYTQKERPLVAQIWGTKPELFYKAAQFIRELKFDGIDINFGCPLKKIVNQGACAAMIDEPDRALDIIQATIKGADTLPVSVKTRIGFKRVTTNRWVKQLLSLPIVAVTLHGRTASEMSQTPVHWDEIGKAVEIRDDLISRTLIIGNGDITSRSEGEVKAKQFKLDGVMIGRGIFHNPWIFNKKVTLSEITAKERCKLLLRHVKLFDKTWGKEKPFQVLKKYFKMYVHGFKGASKLREKLMQSTSVQEVATIMSDYIF